MANRSRATTPSDLDEAQRDAWFGLLSFHAAAVRQIDADLIARHGLPFSSLEVLIRLGLAEGGAMRMSRLADVVLLSRTRVSRLVAELEGQGLVERRACASDGRGAEAALTDAGRALLAEAQETHVAGIRRVFLDHLDSEDVERLAEIWRRLPREACD